VLERRIIAQTIETVAIRQPRFRFVVSTIVSSIAAAAPLWALTARPSDHLTFPYETLTI
jgi:hypothetical protein